MFAWSLQQGCKIDWLKRASEFQIRQLHDSLRIHDGRWPAEKGVSQTRTTTTRQSYLMSISFSPSMGHRTSKSCLPTAARFVALPSDRFSLDRPVVGELTSCRSP